MGCDCQKNDLVLGYEHTRELAQKYANSEQTTVILYKSGDGRYRFICAESKEAELYPAIEYILPLQGASA